MRYILNSAVLTAQGTFRYTHVSREAAREWFAAGPVVSTIGYAETAEALSELLGCPVEVNRVTIQMERGDAALVFRLALPPGSPRIDPKDKGPLGQEILAGHFELGLLERLS